MAALEEDGRGNLTDGRSLQECTITPMYRLIKLVTVKISCLPEFPSIGDLKEINE